MTFTLVICTRNRAESLGRCLDALDPAEIAEQGGEVIVVDNASTDSTQDVIRQHQRDRFGETLRTIVEPRLGLANGKNAGINQARGDIVVFTDDDCYVQRGFFRELVHEFHQGEIDYCTGRILLHDPTDARRAVNYDDRRRVFPPHSFMGTGAVGGGNMALHRRVFERIGVFNPMFGVGALFACEDIDLAGRASQAGFRGAFLPQLVVYHHHGRKPGSRELAATVKAYDLGRGAYYTSRLLAGDWKYIPGWVRTTIKKRRSLRTLYYEMMGAVGYLRARRLNAHSPEHPRKQDPSVLRAPDAAKH